MKRELDDILSGEKRAPQGVVMRSMHAIGMRPVPERARRPKDMKRFSKRFVSLVCAFSALLLLSHLISPAFAFLLGVFGIFAGILGYDIVTRRKWEEGITDKLEKMAVDHERLVREVAKNRNNLSNMKRSMHEIGSAASAGLAGDVSPETRMIRGIAKKLSEIGSVSHWSGKGPFVGEVEPDLAIAPSKIKPDGRVELSDEEVIRIVDHAVKYDQFDAFIQPIVSLPQRKTCFYELFSRLRVKDGTYLAAGQYLKNVRSELMPAIDNLLLLRCLQLVRDRASLDMEEPFFCNIAPSTFGDAGFMGDLIEFISQYRVLAPRLVFEMGQAEFKNLMPQAKAVLNGLAKLGCCFSMDRVTDLKSFSMDDFERNHIHYIKLDASLLMKKVNSPGGFKAVQKLQKQFESAGVQVIVEKIENDAQLLDILDIPADFGQGYLFAEPRKVE